MGREKRSGYNRSRARARESASSPATPDHLGVVADSKTNGRTGGLPKQGSVRRDQPIDGGVLRKKLDREARLRVRQPEQQRRATPERKANPERVRMLHQLYAMHRELRGVVNYAQSQEGADMSLQDVARSVNMILHKGLGVLRNVGAPKGVIESLRRTLFVAVPQQEKVLFGAGAQVPAQRREALLQRAEVSMRAIDKQVGGVMGVRQEDLDLFRAERRAMREASGQVVDLPATDTGRVSAAPSKQERVVLEEWEEGVREHHPYAVEMGEQKGVWDAMQDAIPADALSDGDIAMEGRVARPEVTGREQLESVYDKAGWHADAFGELRENGRSDQQDRISEFVEVRTVSLEDDTLTVEASAVAMEGAPTVDVPVGDPEDRSTVEMPAINSEDEETLKVPAIDPDDLPTVEMSTIGPEDEETVKASVVDLEDVSTVEVSTVDMATVDSEDEETIKVPATSSDEVSTIEAGGLHRDALLAGAAVLAGRGVDTGTLPDIDTHTDTVDLPDRTEASHASDAKASPRTGKGSVRTAMNWSLPGLVARYKLGDWAEKGTRNLVNAFTSKPLHWIDSGLEWFQSVVSGLSFGPGFNRFHVKRYKKDHRNIWMTEQEKVDWAKGKKQGGQGDGKKQGKKKKKAA